MKAVWEPPGFETREAGPAPMSVRMLPADSASSNQADFSPASVPVPAPDAMPVPLLPLPSAEQVPVQKAPASIGRTDRRSDMEAPNAAPAPQRAATAQTYLSAGTSAMDPGPRPLGDIEPVFPPEAGLREGLVVLTLFIDTQGTVDKVTVVRAEPPGLFEQSAVTAFSAAKFTPGMVRGKPVKSQITIEVAFTPFNRGATVSGRSY